MCNLLEPAFRGKGCKSLRVNREPVTTKKKKKNLSVLILTTAAHKEIPVIPGSESPYDTGGFIIWNKVADK